MEPHAEIAVMGSTGSGKTTFINLASGSRFREGDGLLSETNAVQVTPPFYLAGRKVTLIDTPGFDDTTKSDVDILRIISSYLATAYRDGKKLAGLIYMHRISDRKMSGISRRNFRIFRELCGEQTLKNVVIVTNMWGIVDEQTGSTREAELANHDMFLKPTLEAGARMMRHYNTYESTQNILRCIVDNSPITLQIQQEVVDQHIDVSTTRSAQEIDQELARAEAEHQASVLRMKHEAEEALRAQEREAERQKAEEARKRQEEIDRVQEKIKQEQAELQRQKEENERAIRAAEEERQSQMQRDQEEHQRQVEEFERRHREEQERARREREEIQREIRRREHEHRHHGGGCSIQ